MKYVARPVAFYTDDCGDQQAEAMTTLADAQEVADEFGGHVGWVVYAGAEPLAECRDEAAARLIAEALESRMKASADRRPAAGPVIPAQKWCDEL